MAKIYFAPNVAVRYIGTVKDKTLHVSLAKPKPVLNYGDIVIVGKKQGFNLVVKGFGDFEYVEDIEFDEDTPEFQATEITLRELESFEDTKELEAYAKTFDVDVDGRKNLENMYVEFLEKLQGFGDE